ncbi:hypothetical protein F5Y02DRAFT_96341 [Annulohypoxylon stygium]|nr:hypothetical protein F5Y02DRAFT_96341 [Annulohypoxylon stygium]
MRTSAIIAAALCGVALAAPQATQATITAAPDAHVGDRACNVKRDIDCPSLQHYCTTCSEDDLNCETDPRCEWCFEYSWDLTRTGMSSTSNSTMTSTSTSTSTTTTSSTTSSSTSSTSSTSTSTTSTSSSQ